MSDDSAMLSWALLYASLGWAVLPLHAPDSTDLSRCSCRLGSGCTAVGKHPRMQGGAGNSTTDRSTIERWWAKWPEANIGLACGGAFDVLDLDDPSALSSLQGLSSTSAPLPPGPVSRSGRGSHALMQPLGLSRIQLQHLKVDWLSLGRFIVAPPSLHRFGVRYAWEPEGSWQAQIPPVPAWLSPLILDRPPVPFDGLASMMPTGLEDAEDLISIRDRRAYAEAALLGETASLATTPEGGRNDQLYRSVFKLTIRFVSKGALGLDELIRAILPAALATGLPEQEIERTIKSAVEGATIHARNQ